jgi:ankyrin repeat protein
MNPASTSSSKKSAFSNLNNNADGNRGLTLSTQRLNIVNSNSMPRLLQPDLGRKRSYSQMETNQTRNVVPKNIASSEPILLARTQNKSPIHQGQTLVDCFKIIVKGQKFAEMKKVIGSGALALDALDIDTLNTVLIHAVKKGDDEVAEKLIVAGADMSAPVSQGESAFAIAGRKRDIALLKLMLARGADVNQSIDRAGNTLLHLATSNSSFEFLQTLRKFNARFDLLNQAGFTPLGLAIFSGEVSAVESLLNCGADIDQVHSACPTALILAAVAGQTEVAKLLVSYGVDLDVQDPSGSTALIYASHYGSSELVRLLLEGGANQGLVNSKGFTAIAHAALKQHTAIFNLLLEYGGVYQQPLPGPTTLRSEPIVPLVFITPAAAPEITPTAAAPEITPTAAAIMGDGLDFADVESFFNFDLLPDYYPQ